MAFVSVTRLRVRSLRFLPAFFVHTTRTQRQIERADGFRAGALLMDRRWTFWTMTLWDGQAAMRAYMMSGAHRRAMPHLRDWCDEASVVHWEGAEDTLPDWHEADARMRGEGRPSSLRHPSPDHAAMTYAAPRVDRSNPIAPRR